MTETKPRRTALCVRPQRNEEAPAFLHTLADEWVHALALHCDVVSIEQDFDFKAVCDEVQPDFVLFDAVHFVRPKRLTIMNIDAYPHIPRAFYNNCDPHDPMRPTFFEMLHSYGIDTIFGGVEHLKHMPELRDLNCFVIPLFIEPAIYRDQGLERNIPVCVFGGHSYPGFYAWRVKALEEIERIMPTMVFPHPGYNKGLVSPFEVRDDAYARILSASRFALADTTRMEYVVRKHLEIPACGAILIAPDAEVLKPLGFVDMENCILGEGRALYRKIMAVAADPALEARIRRNGYDLVHGRYTRAHWTHIVDWFEARISCGPDEITQQTARFGGFRNVPYTPGLPSIATLHLEQPAMCVALEAGRQAILTGEAIPAAKAGLDEVRQWIAHIAEPRFLHGIMAMLDGDLDGGFRLITPRAGVKKVETDAEPTYQFGLLDPCELAWLLLISAIKSDSVLCKALLDRVEATPHVSVRRAMWVLSGSPHDIDFGAEGLMSARAGDWPSIHWIGQESFPQWLRLIGRLMDANGLAGAADYMRTIAAAFDGDDETEMPASHAA